MSVERLESFKPTDDIEAFARQVITDSLKRSIAFIESTGNDAAGSRAFLAEYEASGDGASGVYTEETVTQ